jgi:poly(3-hydroxybutyrate) depolymerase
MRTSLLPTATLTTMLALGGCQPESDIPAGTGGTSAVAGGTGPVATGGSTAPGTGGRATGGTPTGGAATGGTAIGGKATGGTATGGKATGGSAASGGGSGGLKNPPVPSTGCGTQGMQTLIAGATAVSGGLATSRRLTMTSGGSPREYIIDIPSNYDANKPYRLFFGFHWIGSTDTAVATGSVSNGGATNWGFYGLHRMAANANDPAVFVAPQGLNGSWGQQDHTFFDDMLKQFSAQLCIDTSRVFITGFSFGGMITYSLSTNHQTVIRAAVGIAPANYNIYLPTDTHLPIPWMSTTGMSDGTCPFDGGNNRGAKYAAIGHATDNGCTIPATIPTTTVGSKTHLCYDFQGCKEGYPVKTCTFDGGHIAAAADGGTSDNGLTSWIPTESWKFFTQF